ncbi:ABC transporter ATP-binding protein/permease [Candidatus Corynebacterium faecigallinarum]|uniref:ABC transporter ATP-binding protein/permease n=1 Tax=Candidatus Corynebacterium faecigallinarum TaxID=2838528 RepID=UPI003FD2E81C
MIVRELWREAARFPGALTWSVLLLVLVCTTHIAQAVAIASAMSSVLGGHASDVLTAIAVILAIALIRFLLSLAQSVAAARLGGHVRLALRRRAMHAALVPSRLHDTAVRDGSLRASLGDGIDGTDAYVSKYIPAIAQVLLACPLVIAAVTFLNFWAGGAIALAVILALVGPMAWKRMMSRRGLDHWDSYEALSADFLEALRGMATLRTLGDVPGTRKRLHTRSEALRRATERVMRVSLAETGVTDFAIQAGVVAAAMTAIVHAVTGHPPALEVYLILLLSSEAFRPIRDLSRHWHAGFLGLTAIPGLAQIGAFTDSDQNQSGTTPSRLSSHEGSNQAQQLHVQGVRYQYPDTEHPVLDGLDLTAERGTLTAIVGTSGAGKSTLFDVLLGFLSPSAGTIQLDGRPLHRDDIAVVSQRPVLFTGTVRDNLAVTGEATETDLTIACRAAGILDEIHALPAGFDSPVAEAGTSLSGGQRQRLALARALLAGRPVLLVDEPTSALDDARAQEVVRTLHQVARDRIVIMISHRPETLADAGALLRLNDGRLDRSTT